MRSYFSSLRERNARPSSIVTVTRGSSYGRLGLIWLPICWIRGSISTAKSRSISRSNFIEACFEVTREDAIRWITANPAWALGLEAETGTFSLAGTTNAKPLTLRNYAGYAAGDMANNLAFSMHGMFLLIYYTNVVGPTVRPPIGGQLTIGVP